MLPPIRNTRIFTTNYNSNTHNAYTMNQQQKANKNGRTKSKGKKGNKGGPGGGGKPPGKQMARVVGANGTGNNGGSERLGVASLRRAIQYPCGDLNGLQFLPGPAGRIVFRTNASLTATLATSTTNVFGSAWNASAPGAWKVNHDTLTAIADPARGSISFTSNYSANQFYANSNATYLTEVASVAFAPVPVASGMLLPIGACLRMRYIGKASDRSGYAAGCSGSMVQLAPYGYDLVGAPGSTGVNTVIPLPGVSAATLANDGASIEEPEGIEVVADMSIGDDIYHAPNNLNQTTFSQGVCTNTAAAGRDHGICMGAMVGLQPGAKVLITAHFVYEWCPNINEAFDFAGNRTVANTGYESILPWITRALKTAGKIDWVRAYNRAVTLMTAQGGNLRIEM